MSSRPAPSYPHHPNNPHTLEAKGLYDESSLVPPTLLVLLNLVNALTQLLLGAVAVCAFSLANIFNYQNTFSVHIYLCVTGYVLLMSQAILSFNPHAGWARSLKYPEKRAVHGCLQILGSTLAISGSVVRILDTDVHFDSAHSITGMVALMLTGLSLLGGFLNFLLPGRESMSLVKTAHTCVGSWTIIMAFICLCFGFNDWYRFRFGNNNADLAMAFTVFALAGILISAFSRTIQKIIIKPAK